MIRVLIVDDSAVVREVMQELLKRVPDIRVIGVASDPIYALARMEREWPDVVVLDVDMPRMDGISFLKQLMREHPTPVVVCSSLAVSGSQVAQDALTAGAVAVIAKPSGGVSSFLRASESELVQAVREAASASVLPRVHAQATLKAVGEASSAAADPARARAKKSTFSALKPVVDPRALADDPSLRAKRSTFSGLKPVPELTPGPVRAGPGSERMVAIGISTGGIQALEFVLAALPPSAPGLVIVQHMPELFTRCFAERIDRACQIEVREARDGDVVARGRALIAPGGMHTQVQRVGAHYVIEVIDGPPVSRHRPSVDVLFHSVAAAAGPNALGIIMTGMGDDGARGLKEMYDAGAHTVAQDEASCVVFGMPKEALELGGVRELLGLNQLPSRIASFGATDTVASGR